MSPSQQQSSVEVEVDRPDVPRIHQVATLKLCKLVVTETFNAAPNPAMMDFLSMQAIAENADELTEAAARAFGRSSDRFFTIERFIKSCLYAVDKPPSELILGEASHAA